MTCNYTQCTSRGLEFFSEDAGTVAYTVMLAFIAGFVGLIVVTVFTAQVLREPRGTEHMQFVSDKIHEGAKDLCIRSTPIFPSSFSFSSSHSLSFSRAMATTKSGMACTLASRFFEQSCHVGWLLWNVHRHQSKRRDQACTKSMNDGLRVAFKSGAVMGLTVVSFGLFGLAFLYIIFTIEQDSRAGMEVHLRLRLWRVCHRSLRSRRRRHLHQGC